MKIKSSKQFPNGSILDCFYDGSSIYTLELGKTASLTSFDPQTFKKKKETLVLGSPIHMLSKPTWDKNFIYLPTKVGYILMIEKASNNPESAHLDLGSMIIMSDIYQDEQNVYCVCGVPLSINFKVETENFCVVIMNKVSGKKTGQTQCMNILPVLMSIEEDLWVSSGKTLYQYKKSGECVGETALAFAPSYPPLVTKRYICVASAIGSLEIFNKDFTRHKNLMLKPNESPPVCREDVLYWVAGDEVLSIDLAKGGHEILGKIKGSLTSSTIMIKDNIYCSNSGCIIEFNIRNKTNTVLNISNQVLSRPVWADGNLFTYNSDHIFQIEIKT